MLSTKILEARARLDIHSQDKMATGSAKFRQAHALADFGGSRVSVTKPLVQVLATSTAVAVYSGILGRLLAKNRQNWKFIGLVVLSGGVKNLLVFAHSCELLNPVSRCLSKFR